MNYYLYILHSVTANKYYVGHTHDPWNRENQHNTNNIKKYTGKNSDWKLMAVFLVSENRADAFKLEMYIKKQKSRLLIQKLIDPKFIPNKILAQLVRVQHVRDSSLGPFPQVPDRNLSKNAKMHLQSYLRL